jgi:hypothetical protein
MAKPGGKVRDIFFWNYGRGTLPYDILCGLILAFVFFVPRSCFAPKPQQKTVAVEEKLPPASSPQQRTPSSRSLPQYGK